MNSLASDFEACRVACFAAEKTMLRQLEGPANYLETKSFVEQIKDEKVRNTIMASVKEAQFKGVAHDDDEQKKERATVSTSKIV